MGSSTMEMPIGGGHMNIGIGAGAAPAVIVDLADLDVAAVAQDHGAVADALGARARRDAAGALRTRTRIQT